MNQRELVAELSHRLPFSLKQHQLQSLLSTLSDICIEQIQQNKHVHIGPIGQLKPVVKKSSKRKHPLSGEIVHTRGGRDAVFQLSKSALEQVQKS